MDIGKVILSPSYPCETFTAEMNPTYMFTCNVQTKLLASPVWFLKITKKELK